MYKIIKSPAMKSQPLILQYRLPAPVKAQEAESVFDGRGVDEIAAERAQVILAEAQRQGEASLRAAQLDAARLKGEAESLYAQAKEEGHRAGFAEGLVQGRQAAEREMRQVRDEAVQNANHLVRLAESQQLAYLEEAQSQVVELTLAVVRKVLAREQEENPFVVLPIVTAAVEKIKDQENIHIRVNPEEYETVLLARRDLQLLIGREEGLRITADHTVAVGGCLVETSAGTVDARLETQLEMVRRALKEVAP